MVEKAMMLLSVIVPVYKSEAYLVQCVESILNQSYPELEVILVDDGSPDSSPQICDEFAKNDSRVCVIHKDNGGLVSSRKAGVKKARGKYITFVDGDDWIESNLYEELMRKVIQYDCDCITYGYVRDNGKRIEPCENIAKTGVYRNEQIDAIKKISLFTGTFYEAGILPCVWNKIYKKDLLKEYEDKVAEKICVGEDAAVTYPVISACNSLIIDNECKGYHYRIVENSMSRVYDELYFERIGILLEDMKKTFEESSSTYMMSSLPYYALYMFKFGLDQVLSRANKKSIIYKKKQIELACEQLGIDNILEKIDFNKMDRKNQKWVKQLKNHKIWALILNEYVNKLYIRAKSILNK